MQCVLYVCVKRRMRAVAQHAPSQNSMKSEHQEKSVAPTSAGAVLEVGLDFTLATFLTSIL